jgi:hypothetical protein
LFVCICFDLGAIFFGHSVSYFRCLGHRSGLFAKGFLKKCFLIYNFRFSLLGDNRYLAPSVAVVSGILDMRKRKRVLHFVVGEELLPHAIINIPSNEKMHIGVFHFSLFHFASCCLFSSPVTMETVPL